MHSFQILHDDSFLSRDSVKQLDYIRKHQRDQNEHGNNPEHNFVNLASPRHCAYFPWLARLGWSKNATASEEQRNDSSADKERTVRFKPREVSDPRTAQTHCDQ